MDVDPQAPGTAGLDYQNTLVKEDTNCQLDSSEIHHGTNIYNTNNISPTALRSTSLVHADDQYQVRPLFCAQLSLGKASVGYSEHSAWDEYALPLHHNTNCSDADIRTRGGKASRSCELDDHLEGSDHDQAYVDFEYSDCNWDEMVQSSSLFTSKGPELPSMTESRELSLSGLDLVAQTTNSAAKTSFQTVQESDFGLDASVLSEAHNSRSSSGNFSAWNRESG